MKNIKCLLGMHDYEIVEKKNASEIKKSCLHKILSDTYNNIMIVNDRYYFKKVCLRCGKIIDEITPKKKEIIEIANYSVNRTLKAMEWLNEKTKPNY